MKIEKVTEGRIVDHCLVFAFVRSYFFPNSTQRGLLRECNGEIDRRKAEDAEREERELLPLHFVV